MQRTPITFYPGPAKIYPQIAQFWYEAYQEGILSINHRSSEFEQIYQKVVVGFRQKLNLPSNYHLFFVSSATECWQIIAQSYKNLAFLHFFCGSFGEKWYKVSQQIPDRQASETDFVCWGFNQPLSLEILKNYKKIPQLIAFCQNETANGTCVSFEIIAHVHQKFPEALIALDLTSSLGGVSIDWQHTDIAFASVQKCLGLPAGLAVLICSPKAIEKAQVLGQRNYYNNILNLYENAQKWQTTHTPNVMNIFLLSKVLEILPNILQTQAMLEVRATDLYNFFETHPLFQPLITAKSNRSATVIAITALQEKNIEKSRILAKSQNIILGKGYGGLKNSTFRIANFPQIDAQEIALLKDFFANFS
ncbi:MAG: aminotransferase class V-fold PLP-dependent enzyme [Microscillaceae bacterium]|nr:aminotransferase class V-fold PLP-dependent enzyme [Microscillaceae bacterium]MDW8459848.1 aminotransferase class V-fold PLP-dependent enzyme [Cytophagales bacterium]